MARSGLCAAVGIAVCMATFPAAFAADVAAVVPLGFSADGERFAFEQYGVHDGGPSPYAEIHVLDVAENRYLAAPLRRTIESSAGVSPESALASLRREVRVAAAPLLQQAGIVDGETGRHLIHHPATDLGADAHEVRFAVAPPVYGRPAPDEYRLRLVEQVVDAPDPCVDWQPVMIFTLSLRGGEQAQDLVLQKDRRLPSSRGCASRYRVRDVWLYGGRALVVVVSYAVPGFEGRSVRHLAVTGMLPSRAAESR